MKSIHRYVALATVAFTSLILAGCSIEEASSEKHEEMWATSAHADANSAAFTHWNDADPPEVPVNCAKCHSTTGYHDFLGVDGSTPDAVDDAAPVGTTVECEACHNDVSKKKKTAVMPSGAELERLGNNADCMECHQGRASTVQVDAATDGMDVDTVSRDLSFVNIHNNAAGPTLFGSEALGGYEYDGQEYEGRFQHAPGFKDCTGCHNPHTLRVNTPKCRACHPEARSTAHLPNIRMQGIDFDGDGDDTEGIQGEIETLQEELLQAIRFYGALAKGLDRIVYEPRSPYFLNEETGEPYETWTPKLLRAAYNYHYTVKGDGGYAHNPSYTIQLLYDSLEDLGARMSGKTRP